MDMRPKVLSLLKLKSKGLEYLKQFCDVDVIPYPGREELKSRLPEYDAIIVPLNYRLDSELIASGTNLKVISAHSAGYDNIDVDEATRRGIYVTRVTGLLSEAVAEFTVGLTIALMRRIPYFDSLVRSGEWDDHQKVWSRYKEMNMLFGKTVGILGMGAIGKAILRRMKALGAEVVYWSRTRKDVDAEYLEVDELIKRSHVIILILPLTPETKHIIDERRVKMMEGKYLINVGRGALVDLEAVNRALKEGKLKGFATDVYPVEPLTESELFKEHFSTVLTPHYAGATVESVEDISYQAAKNVIKVLRGEVPEDLVNWEVLKVRPPEEVRILPPENP